MFFFVCLVGVCFFFLVGRIYRFYRFRVGGLGGGGSFFLS